MKHVSSKHQILILGIIVLNILCGSALAKIPAVIVFGDSTVDSGNNNNVSTPLKSNFKPYGRDFYGGKSTGRFSNGRIPPDFISEAFGLKPLVPAYLDPAYNISEFASGVCFASAGTGYDNATSHVLEVEYYKEFKTKLRIYLGARKANPIIHEALYIVSLGTNDFGENYYVLPQTRVRYTVDQFLHFILGLAEKFLRQIYAEGARKIAYSGLPPMGCLPLERTTNIIRGKGCIEEYNEVALNFNGKLNGMVMKLNSELKGFKVVFTNPYDILLLQIIGKHSSYGFEEVGVACCGTGMFEMAYLCNKMNPFTCKDANKYVFWDSFHPTEKTNRIISDHLFKSVVGQFLT